MSYPFSEIVIIYNPNSTGHSKRNALELQKNLKQRLPKNVTIGLKATSHAGHAAEIGERYAKKDNKTLLISSSGDGGYNELVNGVLAHTTKHIATMVLPSGNANDHHHATSGEDIIECIVAGKTTKIDALKVQTTVKGKSWTRYAHSYAGVGLTAHIGRKLTEANLNPINEKWLTLKYLLRFKHVTVRNKHATKWHRYSSIVFGNIDRMSKILKLGDGSRPDDGKFEVYETRERSFLRLVGTLLIGATIGLKQRMRTAKYEFVAKRAIELQCDGEVVTIDGGSLISVTILEQALRAVHLDGYSAS